MKTTRVGRRSGSSESREDVLSAARALFAEHGYQRTTIRLIAERAGVDPSLVIYFFSTKEQLFMACMPKPSEDASDTPKLLAAMPRDKAAQMLAQRIVESIKSPETSNILAVMRAASSKPESVSHIRSVFLSRTLLPMITELGLSRPKERAALLAAVVTGLTFVHEMLDIEAEWGDLDKAAQLELISRTIELALTTELD
nr:HTH-type transcriptional repressor AcnR [Cryobacterium sp. SO1]